MEPVHYWFIAGIVLFGLEILTMEFSLASFGMGAFAGGIATWLGYELEIQTISFAVISLIFFFGFRPKLKELLYRSSSKRLHGVSALEGKTANVIEKIQNLKNSGRVQINGEDWRAKSLDNLDIEKNQEVVVKKIEGATVYVEKIN